MRQGAYHLLFLVLLAMVGTCQASAEKRVALVIGNANYQHAGKLRNPKNDALDIAAALKRTGFDVTLGLDLTENQFGDVMSEFSAKISGGADVALFFYAGHGIQYRGVNYLIPVDARLKDEFRLKRETIALTDIISQIEEQVSVNLVFLDACRDNPLADTLKRSLRGKGRTALLGRGLARVRPSGRDTLIAFSAAPGAIAADGTGRNSPFTKALLKHIETPDVEIEVMLKRVTGDVRKITGHKQEPERLSKLTVEFYFRQSDSQRTTSVTIQTGPSASEEPSSREAADAWAMIKDSRDVTILTAFVERFGSTFYGTLARTKLEEIQRKPGPGFMSIKRGIAGKYRVNGTNPDGSKYRGFAIIWKDGESYRMKWRIGNSTYGGKGGLKDGVLIIDWGQSSPVIYTIKDNGMLSGIWSNGAARETLSPEPLTKEELVGFPAVMTLVLQIELDRVGCNPGPIDGEWGSKSRQALKRFADLTKLGIPTSKPSLRALEVIKDKTTRVCTP